EHAVKFARQVRGLPNGWVITRDRSYHGASYACMAFSGDARTRHQIDPGRYAVAQVASPYAYRCPFGSSDESECGQRAVAAVADEIDRKGAESVAAVWMEPIAGTNGIVAPDNYLPGLGGEMLLELKRLQQRHRLIGDVRGGHGLFAIIELVSDPISREPLAPWPQTPPQLTALVEKALAGGVSFAVRGNLIILAPPLVIEKREVGDSLALLDRLLGEM